MEKKTWLQFSVIQRRKMLEKVDPATQNPRIHNPQDFRLYCMNVKTLA